MKRRIGALAAAGMCVAAIGFTATGAGAAPSTTPASPMSTVAWRSGTSAAATELAAITGSSGSGRLSDATGVSLQGAPRSTAAFDPAAGPTSARSAQETIFGADNRWRVRNTRAFPQRATVLILYRGLWIDGRVHSMQCSGALIGPQTVATAGHCVHFYGRFATDVMVIPGAYVNDARQLVAPYGWCGAANIFTVNAWATRMADDYDIGAIKLDCTVGNTTGWLGMADRGTMGSPTRIYGYPGNKNLEQWAAPGTITAREIRRTFFNNDITAGVSGAAVLRWQTGATPVIEAIATMAAYDPNVIPGAVPPYTTSNHGPRMNSNFINVFAGWRLQ